MRCYRLNIFPRQLCVTLILLQMTMLMLLPVPVLAETEARPGKTDPRIKVFTYHPRDVFRVTGHYGYTSHILFGSGEVIEHVAAGDSLAWHILPKDNHLFLKPIEDNAGTNLTVLTNKRAYNFILEAREARGNNDQSLTFAVSFHYPEEALAAALVEAERVKQAAEAAAERRAQAVIPERSISPEDWNLNYTRKGSERLAPVQVFDDGEFTYFQFPPEIEIPAIFAVDENDEESLINFHRRGKYIVIQRIAERYALRRGSILTCIYNAAWQERVTPSVVPEAA